MNGHRSLLVASLVVTLFVFAILWFSLPPTNAYARPTHIRTVDSGSSASEIASTSAFTVYLPLIMKNFAPLTNLCAPGQTIIDPANDVAIAYIDVTSLNTTLNGQTLTATLQLRNVPSQLTFNRVGVPQNSLEYEWAIFVDVDNNPQTGVGTGPYKGAEYELSAMHFVFTPNSPITEPIASGVQKNVWQYNSGTNSWSSIATATLTVDSLAGTMTLVGNIPGINLGSRLFFYTYDYNPGGSPQTDTSFCAATGQSPSGYEVPMVIQQNSNDLIQHWSITGER